MREKWDDKNNYSRSNNNNHTTIRRITLTSKQAFRERHVRPGFTKKQHIFLHSFCDFFIPWTFGRNGLYCSRFSIIFFSLFANEKRSKQFIIKWSTKSESKSKNVQEFFVLHTKRFNEIYDCLIYLFRFGFYTNKCICVAKRQTNTE